MNTPRSPFILVAALACAVTGFAAEPNTLTAEEQSGGWKLLFDGKTTTGWHAIGKRTFPEKGWVVDSGTLKNERRGGGGDIVTDEVFTDFELAWEWRIEPAGNSGLKYNLPDPNKGVGCEYQLLDDDKNPDAKLHGATRRTAGLYDVLAPADERKLKPVGNWNESRIIVRGNHVEHWLNGGKTLVYEFGSEALKKAITESKFKGTLGFGVKTRSPILLQDHGDEIAFRSVKVRTPAVP